ncbi:MAG: hypothetical protein E6J81_19315 [Deltaproteobacteria bacterium]|nr:MAG: hypothetical protein E6J81_19315 [Deltaproteobacteria bacterium]TMA86048.1 MAG: hypothetical protein E6J77_11370 [Deltaproteobacteria bacterium]
MNVSVATTSESAIGTCVNAGCIPPHPERPRGEYYGHAFGQGVVKRAFAAAGADDGYLELAYPVPTWTRQRASSI